MDLLQHARRAQNLGVTGIEKCHQLSKGLVAKLSGRARTRLKLAPVSPLPTDKWNRVLLQIEGALSAGASLSTAKPQMLC